MAKILNQRDIRWGGVMLGNSGLSIHNYGCYVTAFCQGINSLFGTSYTPDFFAHNAALFDANGMFLVDKACEFIATKNVHLKHDASEDYAIAGRVNTPRILSYLHNPISFVIVRIGLPNDKTHFALVWGRFPSNNDFKIADPEYGDIRWIKPTYPRWITGARFFSKN